MPVLLKMGIMSKKRLKRVKDILDYIENVKKLRELKRCLIMTVLR